MNPMTKGASGIVNFSKTKPSMPKIIIVQTSNIGVASAYEPMIQKTKIAGKSKPRGTVAIRAKYLTENIMKKNIKIFEISIVNIMV